MAGFAAGYYIHRVARQQSCHSDHQWLVLLQDCWQVVCVASHPEDYYHERCIQKFMRAMPGKNYDP